jgi:hypothetical protein
MTVRTGGTHDGAQRAAIDAAVHLHDGHIRWRSSARSRRSYGLLELPGGQREVAAAAASGGAIVYDSPIIALAVFPAVAEALPPLLAALGGEGRPDGVIACEPFDGGIVIEWDLERSGAAVVLGVVDVELRRFHSSRTAELLTPLPAEWTAKVAAEGLQAPEIARDRVLEDLIERAGLRA